MLTVRLALLFTALFAICASACVVTVRVESFSFSPASVSLPAGGTVCWTGLSSHNVAEEASPTASKFNGGFRSGDVDAVTSWSHTFNTSDSKRTFFYFCEAHHSMQGSVTVTDPTRPPTPSARPTTAMPTTTKPTTAKPTTAKPTTAKPTTAKPTTAKPTTAKPTTPKPTTAKPTTPKPATAKPTTAKPATK